MTNLQDPAKTAADWKVLVEEWKASGDTQRAFCRTRSLNPNTFNYWKIRVLENRDPRASGKKRAPKSNFSKVMVSTSDSSKIEVCLPNGLKVFMELPETRLIPFLKQVVDL